MCGIAGFFRGPLTDDRQDHQGWLAAMGNAIRHRGPDASGVWLDERVGLVHRRLSILDLSTAGNQPMISESGRYVIVFNGEIYNFKALRQQLASGGCTFRTQTDTEVLLKLFERDGERCLDELNGMFAFAIWDTQACRLFLARDRLGKKPLYYFFDGQRFAFASELKALTTLPFVKKKIRPDSVKDFFAYQYVPDPKTIYKNVYKLPPGFWMSTDGGLETDLHQYWDVSFGRQNSAGPEELADGLYNLIDDAVRLRMVSDVPLGAFLSGGIDSSAVVGLMAGHSPGHPVTTCAIGFDSERFDEVQWARKVANRFRTNHHEFTVRDSVSDNLETISRFFDEPFADPSFVPTYYVSQLARQQVTVALAGDGGDENFAGYSKYVTDLTENQLRRRVPEMLRLSCMPTLAKLASRIPHPIGGRAQSLFETLALEPDEAFFVTNSFFRRSVWNDLVHGDFKRETEGYDPANITRTHYHNADTEDHLSRILYTDIKTYLPGDILVKVDRMSMANSLETRAPLLDYRVVEYAASIPSRMKLNGREKKDILKKAFGRLLPEDVLYRKKMGFSVPLAEWLRKEIRPLAESIFRSDQGGLAYVFNMVRVRELWYIHLKGDSRYTQELWTMIAFELWWRSYYDAC